MVAFTGGLVRTISPQAQKSTNTSQDNSDRLIEVTGYDVKANTMFAKQVVKMKDGTEKEFKLQVTVDPEAVLRGNKSVEEKNLTNTIKFKGHLIDEKMEKDIPVGKRVVLEKAKVLKVVKKDNENVLVVQAQRVFNVPSEEADRCFEGIMTVNMNREGNRVNFVQHWADNAIAADDTEAIEGWKTKMQEIVDGYGKEMFGKSVVYPSIGVQLRAIVPHKDEKNADVAYQVIDTSGALDYIPAQKDAAGEIIKKAHPLDPENFQAYLDGYTQHIQENFAAENPDVKIEVCVYFNYKASPMSTTLVIKDNKWDPISQMATCKTRLSQDPDSVVQGKNWAVKGIVQISDDRAHRNGRQVDFIPTYFVNRLHANNIKGHVHSWVHSSDGKKTVPHPQLQRIKDADVSAKQSASADEAPAQSQSLPDDPFERSAPM